MLTRLGRFTVRRRRLVLSFTVLFMVAAAVLGTRAFGVLQDDGFADPSSESSRADAVLDARFDTAEPNVLVVVTAEGGDVDDPAVAAAADDLADAIRAVPHVVDVTSYWDLDGAASLRSTDGDRALVLTTLEADGDDEEAAIEAIRDLAAAAPTGITAAVGGEDAANLDIATTIEGDLGRAELIAVPITLVLLLLVFGGLVAASLPLFVGIIAVLGTFLSLYVIGSLTDVSVYAINLTTALGLGLAIDYSLFIVSRYREELRAGRSVEDAVVRSVETAGRTVTISALTVAVSLAALLVFPQYFLRSFAYAGITVVLLAMVASVVALPALLGVVGTRIDAVRVFRHRAPRPEHEGFWYRQARRVMRRPLVVAIGVVAVLLFLGSPFLRVSFGAPDDRVLPTTAPARVANDQLRESFAGNAAETFPVVVEGASAGDGAALDALAADISDLSGVARVDGPRGTFVDGAARRPGERSVGAVRDRRRRAPGGRPGDRDRVTGGRGVDPRRPRRRAPRSTWRSVARRHGSSTPSRRSRRGCPGAWPSSSCRRPSCCSCCRAACSCRSRRSCSTPSASRRRSGRWSGSSRRATCPGSSTSRPPARSTRRCRSSCSASPSGSRWTTRSSCSRGSRRSTTGQATTTRRSPSGSSARGASSPPPHCCWR